MNVEEASSSSPKIVVFSDYICPFCFIGKSRIDRLRKEFQLDVEWRNIEIHPETPLDGIRRVRLASGFYSQLWLSVERLTEESGVEIRPPPVLSNSSLALIGSEYAREGGKFESFHDAVFRAYWQEGKNIGDLSVLSMIAEKVGLSAAGMQAYIKEGSWADPVERNRKIATEHNVSGVPTFIVGRQQVVGAQPYEVVRSVFLKEFVSNPKVPKVGRANQAEGEICADGCDITSNTREVISNGQS